jgi:hypothetical protein
MYKFIILSLIIIIINTKAIKSLTFVSIDVLVINVDLPVNLMLQLLIL